MPKAEPVSIHPTLPGAPLVLPAPEPAPKPEPVASVVEKPVPAEPAFPDLRLQGLLLSSRNPSAIINGKTLYENDRLAGARLVAIGRSNVVMEFQKTRKTLNLNSRN